MIIVLKMLARRVQNLRLSFETLVPAQVKCRSNAVGNHKFHPESQTQLCLAADIDNLLGAIIFCNFFGFNPLNTILATFLFQHVLKLIRRSSYFISAVCHDLPISVFFNKVWVKKPRQLQKLHSMLFEQLWGHAVHSGWAQKVRRCALPKRDW